MSQTNKELWESRLAYFDQLVARCPEFERKGKTMPYTSSNGHMFSLLNKAGELGVRLSKEEGQVFRDKHQTGNFTSHGATMRGYVLIPESLYGNDKTLIDLLQKGFEYVNSLPPK
ncbi:MAG: hypothetical protein KTR30_03470 [Saprospiraceae bacterium]|nr:hypothetical protein [Saprospiraceae bacterium]